MLNRLRNNSLLAIICSLFLLTPFTGFAQNPVEEIKQEAQAAKLTPALLSVQQEAQQKTNQKAKNLRQAASSDNETGLTKVDRTQVHDGLIGIEAVSNEADGQSLLNSLQALGLQEGRYFKRIVFGYFPIDKLGQLKSVNTLHVARPAYTAFKNVGKTTSQGDRAQKSDVARQMYNVSGAGSKVGVISDSYNSLRGAADGVASGDLPPNVQVVRDIPARYTGSDEGRAMAEIVHDVAPGANIAFNTGYETKIDFALGILNLAAAGCNIIVDDLIYFAEPFFQDGILAQVVDEVVKTGKVTYFSSAGNNARQSYSSGFRNSGKPAPGLDLSWGHAHDFVGNGTITQRVQIAPGGEFFPIFQWSDPFYSESILSGGVSGAKTDMDILVYYRGVLQLGLSSIDGNVGGDPIESIDIVNNSSSTIEIEVAYVKYEGPDPSIIKFVDFGFSNAVQYATQSSTTYGHANAEKAIAVGAVRWSRTPVYDPVNSPIPVIESFSSAGGTPILFTEYGQSFPTRVRLKPEISGPNGGNTTFFGQAFPGGDGDNFPNFFGTSASAPHAAAVAALLQEKAKLAMSPADILKRLEVTAIDMDDPLTPGFDVGFDFRTGYGFIQAD
ncbi:S8 family peptidase, partial [Spirosoma validum]